MKNAEQRKRKLETFFEAYQKRFADALEGKAPDVEGVTGCFAEWFIESSPVGVIAGKNDDTFRETIPKGYESYKSIGTTGMTILSKEITLLDNFHSIVKVHWKSDYEREDGSAITINFDIIYLLSEKDREPKIFAYITGDEQKALDDNGLKPYK